MKRIQSACLLQTIHFPLKEDLGHDVAVRYVKEEFEHYKEQLQRNHTRFQITEETQLPDGSLLIHIRRQYNTYSCDEYIH